MKECRIETLPPYSAVVAKGCLANAGERIAACLPGAKFAVVTDDTVRALWGDLFLDSLSRAGIAYTVFSFPGGEEHKTLGTVERLYSLMERESLSRTDGVIALGGGIVSDVAGFAAATYLRGIPYVTVPTTLLAAVDAAVGGKTGVNLGGRKNRIGAFHQPSLVLCDPDTFRTLPPEILSDGMAEVIKYGMLFDAAFPGELRDSDMEAAVARCIRMKADVVTCDERDTGVRQLLNFGHTAAHAVEACSGGTVRHGHAVAIGMVAATRAAVKHGLCKEETRTALVDILTRNGLPVSTAIPEADLCAVMAGDKKRAGNTVTLVLPREYGKCELYPVPCEKLGDFFAGCFA